MNILLTHLCVDRGEPLGRSHPLDGAFVLVTDSFFVLFKRWVLFFSFLVKIRQVSPEFS